MKCTLTNDELIAKAHEWIKRLAMSGGQEWCLRVPVDFNNDPDMIFTELCNRLKDKQQDGWISVETPPVVGDFVLLCNEYWVGVGKYQPDEDKECPHPDWQDETSQYIEPRPTHWRELPVPPTKPLNK